MRFPRPLGDGRARSSREASGLAVTTPFARCRSAWVVGAALFVSYAYFYQAGGWNQNSRFALVRAILERHTLQIDAYQLHNRRPGPVAGPLLLRQSPGRVAAGPRARRDRASDRPTRRCRPWVPPRHRLDLLHRDHFHIGGFHRCRRARRDVAGPSLGCSTGAAVFAATAYGVATPAWCYATIFMGHGTIAGCLMLAYGATIALDEAEARRQDRLAWVIGLTSGWAVVSEFQAAVPAALIAGLAMLTVRHAEPRRVRAVGSVLSPPARWPQRSCSSITSSRSDRPCTWDTPGEEGFEQLKQGLFGITFPPGRGSARSSSAVIAACFRFAPLVALMPIGLVSLARVSRRRRASLVAGAIGAYYVLLNASYFYWEGGWAYGPRQLMPGLPFWRSGSHRSGRLAPRRPRGSRDGLGVGRCAHPHRGVDRRRSRLPR